MNCRYILHKWFSVLKGSVTGREVSLSRYEQSTNRSFRFFSPKPHGLGQRLSVIVCTYFLWTNPVKRPMPVMADVQPGSQLSFPFTQSQPATRS